MAYISVLSHGAVGDGVTDDTIAFINANSAAVAANTGLLIEKGLFYIASSISLTVPVRFERGILKPNSNVSIDFNHSWMAEREKIFDTSLGGQIIGTAKLRQNRAMVEWWGAIANSSTPADVAANEASTFLRQRNALLGIGGTVSFGVGGYYITQPVIIDYKGGRAQGAGKNNTTIYYPNNTSAFFLYGDVALAQRNTYGSGISGFSFQGDTSQPEGSFAIYCSELTSTLIQDNEFVNFYRAIALHHCRGPMEKMIRNNSWAAPNVAPAKPGSCFLLVEGDGTQSGFSENIYVESNCGGGGAGGHIGVDFGILVTGVDVLYVTNNHGFGAKTACLGIINDNSNTHIWNIHSANNQWEPLSVEGTEYAILVSGSSGSYLKALFFNGEQIINGNTAGICIQGSDPADIIFTGTQVQFAQGDSISILGGRNIIFNGASLEDCGDVHIRVGAGADTPQEIIFSDITMQQRVSNTTIDYGYHFVKGKDIQINGGRVRDANLPIRSDIDPGYLQINDIDVRSYDSGIRAVPVASTINIPLGEKRVLLSGSGTINTISATAGTTQSASSNRTIMIGNSSGNTITMAHSVGNLYLSGGSWAMTHGSWITLSYIPEVSKWVEIGRVVV